LSALQFLLWLKIKKELKNLRWITSNNKIHNVQLIPLFGETYRVKDMMESVNFEHIYTDMLRINMIACLKCNLSYKIKLIKKNNFYNQIIT